MAFIDNVPMHHKTLKIKLGQTNSKLYDVQRAIEEQEWGDDWFEHECDCEYCDIAESRTQKKRMTQAELSKAKRQAQKLSDQVRELTKTIKGLEGYAAMFNKPISKGDLLK